LNEIPKEKSDELLGTLVLLDKISPNLLDTPREHWDRELLIYDFLGKWNSSASEKAIFYQHWLEIEQKPEFEGKSGELLRLLLVQELYPSQFREILEAENAMSYLNFKQIHDILKTKDLQWWTLLKERCFEEFISKKLDQSSKLSSKQLATKAISLEVRIFSELLSKLQSIQNEHEFKQLISFLKDHTIFK